MTKTISRETNSYSSIGETLNEVSFEDLPDVIEELSDQDLIETVIKSRKEYHEGKTTSYDNLLRK